MLTPRLRRRIWATLGVHNAERGYSTPDNPGWVHRSDIKEQTEIALSRTLGLDEFEPGPFGSERKPLDLHAIVDHGSSERVFDLIEVFYAETDAEERVPLQRDLNDAMVAFACPWRLSDGMFFKVDSEFLEEEVIARSSDLLSKAGFEGAMDEFRTARDHLVEGSARDAIVYAAHSVESTLKAALNEPAGTLTSLLNQFLTNELMDDLPTSKAKAVAKCLAGASILRNELGGHGQGAKPIDVPRPYAELAVHLAAGINHFITMQHLRKNPRPEPRTAEQPKIQELDDEIPF